MTYRSDSRLFQLVLETVLEVLPFYLARICSSVNVVPLHLVDCRCKDDKKEKVQSMSE